MYIGKVLLDFETYNPQNDIYSDGDIENEILDIVKEDREEVVLEKDNRWPILYHLSDIRKNILRWYPFKENSSVLEIGCGCGAITGLFCKKNMNVTCVESSKRRATITAYRNLNCEKLKINVGNFMNLKIEQKFDYVTLIGVLEYALMFTKKENAYEALIEKCETYLNDTGVLIIAIENRLGIKYWAGAAEDHTGKLFEGLEGYIDNNRVKTFSKNELKKLVNKCGFNNIEWYYPYPDYKMPMQVFSDGFLPTGEFLYPDIYSLDKDRITLFDEKKVIQNIADSGDFVQFSNSFLLFCRRD